MSTKPSAPILFYGFGLSGHAHRVELLLRMMDLPFTAIEVDLRHGAHKTPEFLAMHPFGQVPVIDDQGTIVWDSAAIMVYLAEKFGDGSLLPVDLVGRSEVQRWLSIAAGSLANGPMSARVSVVFKRPCDMAQAHTIAGNLFGVMDRYLNEREYLAAQRLTIADLALYAYTAHAPEGGIDLAPYPNLSRWLSRVEAAPGFVPMARSKAGLWAEGLSGSPS